MKCLVLPAGERFRHALQTAAHDHEDWVDRGGLRTGRPGPLDDLIRELEECLVCAEKAKIQIEEDDP